MTDSEKCGIAHLAPRTCFIKEHVSKEVRDEQKNQRGENKETG